MSAAMNLLTVGLVLIVLTCLAGVVTLSISGKPCPEIIGSIGLIALGILAPSPIPHRAPEAPTPGTTLPAKDI
jgi:hypothetical protein